MTLDDLRQKLFDTLVGSYDGNVYNIEDAMPLITEYAKEQASKAWDAAIEVYKSYNNDLFEIELQKETYLTETFK